MNTELWARIESFDLDHPFSEYGFSTRLARENCWTRNFTQNAILEYKKFMYLAGTAEAMVSPSEVVDTVWHQHLIFTQSYTKFCKLIGKQIQHIPSTHNREDHAKFQQAKERTRKLYNATFGEQPKEIWEYADMFDALALDKAKLKLRTFIIIGILAILTLAAPLYFLLRPLYVKIQNPDFLSGYLLMIVLSLVCLELYNRFTLANIVKGFRAYAFIYHLHPLELVYLKTQKLSDVLHGHINHLLGEGKMVVNNDKTLKLGKFEAPKNMEEFTIKEALKQAKAVQYPLLLHQLQEKPAFSNVAHFGEALKKYFIKSRVFNQLFYLNFGLLSLLLMLGFVRLATGLLRDKPVALIFIVLVVSTITFITYLFRLTHLIYTHSLPQFYKKKLLPARGHTDEWEWQYFLIGRTMLTAALIPLVHYSKRDTSNSSTSCGTFGSGCGSSCSSCGGCGGD